ncbi:MAG: hypothetical protein HYV08_13740 [Deltaproteobacteria bacterium]|nr:hypothetical protein [Deltaproteobacteria bacterium]
MSDPGMVVGAILALAFLYVLLPLVLTTVARYRGSRALQCPETGGLAAVSVDAVQAGVTSAFGKPRLRVSRCSLWPNRWDCGQGCLRLPEHEMSGV